MALLNPTFLLGVLVLLYLSSFVFFAIIRILTGVSIQRIGYLSLRRLAYTPRDGCRVEIRGVGLNIHRPTFAQPTWISLALNEVVVTVDIRELNNPKSATKDTGEDEKTEKSVQLEQSEPLGETSDINKGDHHSETWEKLAALKENIKKLHTNIRWLRMIDVVATNSTINVVDVGSLQVGSLTVAVDTRRKMVDHTRLFRFHTKKKEKLQAEWIISLRSVLFTAEGHDSMEVLDHLLLNVHGFLYESRQGLQDASISLKLGRVHIPYDDLLVCASRYKECRRDTQAAKPDEAVDIVLAQVPEEPEEKRGENETQNLRTAVTDSREFISSILRGIKEVQFNVSYVGVTKQITSVKPEGSPILLNASMKEVGIDLHRLDPKSPAHRMYFSPKDIAHEALAAALSISVGIDDGHGRPERLLYIPMATTTVRTTLPSKTIQLAQNEAIGEKNANILFANSVITSPSVDLDPGHLPLLIAMMQPRPKATKPSGVRKHSVISRLLPKANIKFSMHEPVLRMKLQPLQDTKDQDDFDLIISSISSVTVDVESSHSSVEDMHYFLDGSMRLQSHNLYYQTSTGDRFNLITTESFDLKANLAARPDICVEVTGNIQSFGSSMVRPEITDGLRQIVRQLHIDVEPEKRARSKTPKGKNFLRSMPEWLVRYQIEASDFNIEVAGVDEDISDDTRGVSLHLDSFSAEYRAHRLDGLQRRPGRRRTHSRSITQSDSDLTPSPASPRFKRKPQTSGDGRRLALHARGIEAQIVEASDRLEVEPFLNVPRLELAFSTTSDNHGSMFHIQSTIRTFMFQYSLYRHYAVGVAGLTLRRALMRTGRDVSRHQQHGIYEKDDHLRVPASPGIPNADGTSTMSQEIVTIDVKAALVQIKAEMPHEPLMMLRVYGLETGRHRWSTPYMTSKVIRLFVETPRMYNVWSRVIGIKHGRVDLRESRHKSPHGGYVEEKMIDVTSEALRVAVPHEAIVSRITDNFINVIKSVQQLHHRFKTGTNEYILEKKPEPPKNVPKVSVRARNFLFELEDGAFEWKLGIIYRTGRVEQTQRLAREEAFRVKAKRVHDEDGRKGGGKLRSRSTFPRGRGENASSSWFRSRSADAYKADDSGHKIHGGTMPRYDPDREHVGIHGNAKIGKDEARSALDKFNAQSWRKRIDRAYQASRDGMRELRERFWGSSLLPDDVEESENILEVPQRPGLMSAFVSDLHFTIDKPSFAMKDLPDFIHKVGKGMPKDMKYSLLIPMHVAIQMGEARMTLRDYPLPLLHIPGLKAGQSSRMQAVSLKANFVLAEEFRGHESTRKVRVNVVPPRNTEPMSSNEGGFAIEVRRTIGPVKSFSEVFMDINTALPTRITWCPSYQPAVQDMMMVIESFTKPQVDPSERVGFWDKLRLNTHSRVHVAWKGDGDMHLSLKGTRDPYLVTGNGAGFLMCWRNDVRWNINAEDDPKRFMTVDSGEYVLAIPDYSQQVREAARRQERQTGIVTEDTVKEGAIFKKVVMKLSGKVQWMAGLLFERAIEDGQRNFSFKPHYEVVLKNPIYAKPGEDGSPYDAFKGFRSRHIHLSIDIRAPVDRDWTLESPEPSRSYNTVHLTPRFFTHFFQWWGLFSQPGSLPIRQGNLWPGREKNSKKFGRHLATVKYNLLLAPLFLSHIYKHKDAEDYAEHAVSATGIKVRFDSFKLDLHQRREEFNTLAKGKNTQSRTSGIKIHAGQLDLANADIRAVSASLKGTTTEAIHKGSISALITEQDDKPDLSRFTIPDNDFSWIDMDDFVELDWILPTEPHPDTKILPLAFAPRLTYFRQTDIGGIIAGDPARTSPFGNEPTHFCIMTHDDDPRSVQSQLIQDRLDQLTVQMQTHSRNVGDAELKVIQTNAEEAELVDNFDALKHHTSVLKEKELFLRTMLSQMQSKSRTNGNEDGKKGEKSAGPSSTSSGSDAAVEMPPTSDFESDFNNRFVIHNLQFKWNNLLRNIVLRYMHQISQRRGFVYYLSRPAVKFILDIVEEQSKAKANKSGKKENGPAAATGRSSSPNPSVRERDSAHDLEDHIKSFLAEGRRFTNASLDMNGDVHCGTIEDLEKGIAKEFSPQNAYHVRLIAPQIQLQSEKNKKNVVLVTSKGMELKVVEVMDKERVSDTVSGLVQRRFLVNMDSTQFFVTHQKWFQTSLVSMHSGSKYGAPSGSAWPPWVPMEIMFNFVDDPFGFKRVVQKTSAMLRYDKYNNLRLKYNEEVNADDGEEVTSTDTMAESRSDNLWVEFPQARALCNSSQYYAMYVIVLDLLMYSEPLEKTRSERLEKIMLASDFSDLSGTPKMVQKLQERVRQLEDIKGHFQVYSKYLDKKGWEDRLALERDLAACEDELFFLMKAITRSQRKHDIGSDTSALLKWSISAKDIVWHLIQDSTEPLVELQLKDMEYDRTDNSDGSHMNLIRVGKVLGLNLLPDAMYPEIIAPYHEPDKLTSNPEGDHDMIRVYWHMLEAIAGIPVMDHFEVNLVPIKVQLEREAGKRLFEYIFPEMDGEKANGSKSESSPYSAKHPTLELEEGGSESINSSNSRLGTSSPERDSSGFTARAGSLELRLRPTLTSNNDPDRLVPKKGNLDVHSGESHGFKLFRSSHTGKTILSKKPSHETLQSAATPRPGVVVRSSTGFSSKDSKESAESKKTSRWRGGKTQTVDVKQQSDDLTKMIDRASNYMTFAHIRMPSVVLCLSYKGKGERNFEDIHSFVFRLPTLEWHNKTWSNLDLALALKKSVVKALISHTGAIIGNKFSKHRPNAEQRSKLREIATSSVLITPSSSSQHYAGSINDSDDSSSFYGTSPIDYSRSPPRSTRGSTHSSIPAPRSTSRASSVASGRSYNAPNAPAFLAMTTPPTPVDRNDSSTSVDLLRPSSSGGGGLHSSNHRRILRNIGGDDSRPSTSAGSGESDRRKSGGGLRDRLSVFTGRNKRENSDLTNESTESVAADDESTKDGKSSKGKRLGWAPGRTKTG